MRQSVWRALVATALGLGMTAGLARADGPDLGPAPTEVAPLPRPLTPMPPPAVTPPATLPEAMPPVHVAPEQAPAAEGAVPAAGAEQHHPVRRLVTAPARLTIAAAAVPVHATQATVQYLTSECSCWAHHNGFSCGSFKSEFNFVFGGCRYFFGEPCLPGPPPPPPFGGAAGPGTGGNPGGGCGCP